MMRPARSSILSRRTLLHVALGGTVGAALPLAACGQQDSVALMATPLADGIVLIEGAGANVVAARGPDGVVLVDGGLAEHADTLGRFVARELGSHDVAALINTHWHPEQTGSNLRLGRDGVTIVAHENTRLWLTQQIERPWENVVHQPLPAEGLPTHTTYDQGGMTLGDETVEYGFLPQAHTDGDLYVFFRTANVLVAGGVASGAGWPEVDWWTGGWIGSSSVTMNTNVIPVGGGMVSGLERLHALANDDTKIVPASGRVLTKAELAAQIAMYSEVAGQLREMLFKGFGPEDVIAAAPTAAYDAEMGSSDEFLTLAFQSLWGHFAPDA